MGSDNFRWKRDEKFDVSDKTSSRNEKIKRRKKRGDNAALDSQAKTGIGSYPGKKPLQNFKL